MPTYVYNTPTWTKAALSKYVSGMIVGWYGLWLGDFRAIAQSTPIECLFSLQLSYNHIITAAERRDFSGEIKTQYQHMMDSVNTSTNISLETDDGEQASIINSTEVPGRILLNIICATDKSLKW